MAERLGAGTLRRAMEIFAESLRVHRDELNSLNVYPVPDGDTGTNLLMTQEAVLAAMSSVNAGDDSPALGAAIARGSLMGARGNSGVILSQVLRGICESPFPEGGLGPFEFAAALHHASDEATRAVARPVEGTILTVLRDAGAAAPRAAAADGADSLAVLDGALEEGRASLARTTGLLSDLGRAGVVDAGGKGIVLLLDALRAAIADEAPSEPVGPLGPVRLMDGSEEDREVGFAYEVQYLIEAPDRAMPSLRQALGELGDSLVMVGGSGLFNVHVHTNEPDRAVELGEEWGRPRGVQIADLREQVVDCIGGQARAVRVAEQVVALVAVAEGAGLASTFRSLGAVVVRGGPGTNPSVSELVGAIEAARANAVILLPNHENASPAAHKAAGEATKDVLVVESPSIPSGLAAATVFNPMAQPDENARAMEKAIAATGWGELVRAEREADSPAGAVGPGDWIGTAAGQVVSAGTSLPRCAELVGRTLDREGAELVTLIVGADATQIERETVREALGKVFVSEDLEVLDGGQPQHPFLIGVE
jgi:DAK2 domain fusion protein YloV